MILNIYQSKNEFQENNVRQKFAEKIKQKFEKKIQRIKIDKRKFKKTKISDFKIEDRFKKITIYQKFSITSVETNFMLVNSTNVKIQKNVFVFDTTFKSNELTTMNSVMKSELKRSAMNISTENSKVTLSQTG